jgi:hypothetical protein
MVFGNDPKIVYSLVSGFYLVGDKPNSTGPYKQSLGLAVALWPLCLSEVDNESSPLRTPFNIGVQSVRNTAKVVPDIS